MEEMLNDPQRYLHTGDSALQQKRTRSLVAMKNTERSSIAFWNETTGAMLELAWVNYRDEVVKYGIIEKKKELQTFIGHSFLVLDTEGQVILSYTVSTQDHAIIQVKSLEPTEAIVSIATPTIIPIIPISTDLGAYKSKAKTPETTVIFENHTSERLKLGWIDFDGFLQCINVVLYDNPKTMTSYVSHYLALYSVDEAGERAVHGLFRINNPGAVHIVILSKTPFRFIAYDTNRHITLCRTTYKEVEIEGFIVQIEDGLCEDEDELLPALSHDYTKLSSVIPPPALQVLQRIPMWVNKKIVFGYPHTKHSWGGLCYHPCVDWLKENGNMIVKVKSVEIYSTENYYHMRRCGEPSLFVHEFAHAYHDLIGFDRTDIEETFEKAMTSGKYEKVQDYRGKTCRAYAATNAREYFAELSVAYFSLGNYFPFTREDLKSYDPLGFSLIERLWHMSSEELATLLTSNAPYYDRFK